MVTREEKEEEASAAKPKRPKLNSAVFGTRQRESTMNTTSSSESSSKPNTKPKPPFKPAKDDTKPLLQDPILRSDPIETEEALLRLPPFSIPSSTKYWEFRMQIVSVHTAQSCGLFAIT
ncbi:hypothetical protein VNO78_15849 [Psophocarpus tetragonolobus]|uniref:Uncharacterized protein n=1 Tax=Psophocarpus tetragonolobus TaxID=3891 RepID=A0AAN9SEQ5_PSOTE